MANPYIILVKGEDRSQFDRLFQKLIWFVETKINIPPNIVDEFLKLLRDPKLLDEIKLFEQARSMTEKVMSRLSKIKGYYPKESQGKKISSVNKGNKDHEATSDMNDLLEFGLDYFLFVVISAFLKYKADSKALLKDHVICFFYDIIRDYKPFAAKGKNKYSAYKLYVITGILTQEAGFKLSRKKNLSNHEVFHAVRNAVKKYTGNQNKNRLRKRD